MVVTKQIDRFTDIVSKYELFIFDLWGVLHNGQALFPESLQAIDYLRSQNKSCAFLSNSPRRAEEITRSLATGGLILSEDDKVVTSLECFRHYVASNKAFIKNKKIFHLGKTKNAFDDMDVEFVSQIDNADYIALFLFTETLDSFNELKEMFIKAIKLDIPVICINPDMVALHGDAVRYTAGYFAKEYEKLGGKVIYFGKPHRPVYELLLKDRNISKDKVLAIGDSLLTDIKGANDFGIDSVLLYSKGIHKNMDFKNLDVVDKLFSEHNAFPSYTLKTL
jgi:HAD superfamily hydrolase (TIGR01459 family)